LLHKLATGDNIHVQGCPGKWLLNRYSFHFLALMLRCQCPSVCDGSALAHYS